MKKNEKAIFRNDTYETFNEKKYPSRTIPNQTKTIRQYINEFTQPMPDYEGMYAEEDVNDENFHHFLPDPTGLDLHELDQIRNQMPSFIQMLQDEYNSKYSQYLNTSNDEPQKVSDPRPDP